MCEILDFCTADEGVPAKHNLQVDDVLVRNVTTDIRGGSVGRVPDGNSILIFETGNLCIGHLGQLDIVMVPVDGAATMSRSAMVETLNILKELDPADALFRAEHAGSVPFDARRNLRCRYQCRP